MATPQPASRSASRPASLPPPSLPAWPTSTPPCPLLVPPSWFPPLQSFVADLQRFTKNHSKLQCFDLGFALDTFRMVALTSNFRKLQADVVVKACQR